MKQAGYSGLAERSLMASGKRKTLQEEKGVEVPQAKRYKGVHEVMQERGKQKHPTMTDAVYHLGFAKTNSSA